MNHDPRRSTSLERPHRTAVVGAEVHPICSPSLGPATVLIEDGSIVELGRHVQLPEGIEIIDADGRWLLPGFIDAHSHLGIHEEITETAGADNNEFPPDYPKMPASRRACSPVAPRSRTDHSSKGRVWLSKV